MAPCSFFLNCYISKTHGDREVRCTTWRGCRELRKNQLRAAYLVLAAYLMDILRIFRWDSFTSVAFQMVTNLCQFCKCCLVSVNIAQLNNTKAENVKLQTVIEVYQIFILSPMTALNAAS